jgi:hypothetical protein
MLKLFRNGVVGFIVWLGEFPGKELARRSEINERDDETV